VGVGEGIFEGLVLEILVVGNCVGDGVGMIEGIWLGDTLGIKDILRLGTGVVGSFVGVGDGISEGLGDGCSGVGG